MRTPAKSDYATSLMTSCRCHHSGHHSFPAFGHLRYYYSLDQVPVGKGMMSWRPEPQSRSLLRPFRMPAVVRLPRQQRSWLFSQTGMIPSCNGYRRRAIARLSALYGKCSTLYPARRIVLQLAYGRRAQLTIWPYLHLSLSLRSAAREERSS